MVEQQKATIESFIKLPRRIFLDSSVLQIVFDRGEYIWDNCEIGEKDRILNIKNGVVNLEALRNIFFIDTRANFELALSENSLKEVKDRRNSSYLRWAFDVLEHWTNCIQEYDAAQAFIGKGKLLLKRINAKQFGYLSEKDKVLLFDSIRLECDAFLTVDQKLSKNSEHISRTLGIRVLQPFEYWELLEPFAKLYC